MKTLIPMTLLLFSSAVALQVQAAPEDEIKQLEDRRINAMTKLDIAALDAILADDVTYVHSNADADNKEKYLADLKSGRVKYVSIERDEVKVRVYGDAAVVTGRAWQRADVKGRAVNASGIRTLFTATYVKRDGRWRMVALQSTRVPE